MNNGVTIENSEEMIRIEDGFYICERRECKTDSRKITGYLLKPGSHHYQEFIDVGYCDTDCEKLFEDIAALYSYDDRIDESMTPFGSVSYSVMMELGICEKRTFRTVWEKKSSDSMAKLVTAYRDRRLE